MSAFDALTFALEDWFDTALCDMPEAIRRRVEQEFFPMPWDKLSAEQRRSVALQLDYQRDPATQQDQNFWWDFFAREDALQKQLAAWEQVATPAAADLALKETRQRELRQELARMNTQKRRARGDYFPERKSGVSAAGSALAEPAPEATYIPYPIAMHQLTQRLGATPEELAIWIWVGPKDGGIAAYLNANELNPPPRFSFDTGHFSQDYIAPLMACWFKANDIDQFEPADRYITGAALIERWSKRPGLRPAAFIKAKIAESRFSDIHPIFGMTQGSGLDDPGMPPLETGLFSLREIGQIELEDFGKDKKSDKTELPEIGTPEWRKLNAQAAANALHDKPGGSRDKQRQIREIWASGKYSSKVVCAEEEYAALKMSFSAAQKALRNAPKP